MSEDFNRIKSLLRYRIVSSKFVTQPHLKDEISFSSPNKDPLSKLWIGFFDYFLRFPFASEIVQVRLSSNLTREEKWKDIQNYDKKGHWCYKNRVRK